ncbi:MAG: zonular occludens toxin domain-containing protein [Promethearchaeota archaeon]
MFWLVLGDYREGKTLYLVVMSFDEMYEDRKIYANFRIKHPRFRRLKNPSMLRNLDDCVVLLDEAQNWFNSHRSFSLDNDFITDFLHECDKDSVDVYMTAHRLMALGNDFRENCHRIVKCERLGYKDPRTSRLNDIRDFKFSVFSTSKGGFEMYSDLFRYEIAKNYFPVYDTLEKVKRPDDKTRYLEMLWLHDPEKAIQQSLDIVNELEKRFRNGIRFTKDNLRIELASMGYRERLINKFYPLVQRRLVVVNRKNK